MLLNQSETYILWSICKDAIEDSKELRKKYENNKMLVNFYTKQEALAEKLEDFLSTLDSLHITEGPF